MSSTRTILLAAVVTEGLLVIVSCIVAGLLGTPLVWGLDFPGLVTGIATPIPLLMLNHFMWHRVERNPNSVYARFSREVIVPLCKQVTPLVALILALLSGFGEELFFRGVLNVALIEESSTTLAAIITSALFAYVHFIGQIKRYGGMLPLYTGVGLYLWCVVHLSNSLTAGMVCHGIYNFTAILIIRAKAK